MTHVAVTGGAGYIGSQLTQAFLDRGYEVTVIDRFFFGDTLSDLKDNPRLHLIKEDIRRVDAGVFRGINGVCDLAALSNDPAGDLDPARTFAINHEGRARIARLAKSQGVERYVLASSCSLYGFQDSVVDETSPINPLTAYAKANGMAEDSNLGLGDANFCVTANRQATIYGQSRRMRWDLAINGQTLSLFKTGRVRLMRPGEQWRPMVHVDDACRAFVAVMEADPKLVNGQIFNIGSLDQNLQLGPLAERLSLAFDIPFDPEWYGEPDHRSYQVSFEKVEQTLGYRTQVTPEQGARTMFASLNSGDLADRPEGYTVSWYKRLLEADPDLF